MEVGCVANAHLNAMSVLHRLHALHARPHLSLETMASVITHVKLVILITAVLAQPVRQTAIFVPQHRSALHVRLPMSFETMQPVIQVVTLGSTTMEPGCV